MAVYTEILPPIAREPVPPMQEPLLVNAAGEAWLPRAFSTGGYALAPICVGVAMAWTSIGQRIVLCLHGGNDAAPTDEQLCLMLSRHGLRALIADLRSIDAQMDERP